MACTLNNTVTFKSIGQAWVSPTLEEFGTVVTYTIKIRMLTNHTKNNNSSLLAPWQNWLLSCPYMVGRAVHALKNKWRRLLMFHVWLVEWFITWRCTSVVYYMPHREERLHRRRELYRRRMAVEMAAWGKEIKAGQKKGQG